MMTIMDETYSLDVYKISILIKVDKYRLVVEKLDIHEFEFWTNQQDREFFERCYG